VNQQRNQMVGPGRAKGRARSPELARRFGFTQTGAHPFDFAQGKLWSPYQHVTLTFDYLSNYSYQCGLVFSLMTLELGLVLPL